MLHNLFMVQCGDGIVILRNHTLFDIATRTSPDFPLTDDIPFMTLKLANDLIRCEILFYFQGESIGVCEIVSNYPRD
jgi:hypothetical protein